MKHSLKPLVFISAGLIFLLSCQIVTGIPLRTATPTSAPLPTPITKSLAAPTPAPNTPPLAPDLVGMEDTLVGLYEKVNAGVVTIRVLTSESTGGLGSGFVFDSDGHIVTNYHVVEGESDLEVDFPSGYKTRGDVVGIDLDSDLAVIKVEAPQGELHPLTIGDSSQIHVGQTVIAIGNPFGLSGTMTVGIISAQGRTLQSLREAPGGDFFSAGDLIQTDAAINPGNSGGPLLNLNGEVIGINRAIRTQNFSLGDEPVNSGIGFAVASNIVRRVVPELIRSGEYDYPYLGISSLPEITLLQQEALGLPQSTGAYVLTVTAGSPADEAGLQPGTRSTSIAGLNAGGDLITAIDGQEVATFGDLLSYLLNNTSPGDTVALTVLRDGKQTNLDLTLGKRP
ncbi:MAG: trypsin-like peptidase domain-containing protein [Anaerolineales bacterium]|jgi:S1-C subfamily serine protease